MEFFAEYYLQAGAVGVLIMAFVYMMVSQSGRMSKQDELLDSLTAENREQTKVLSTLEKITIKLIDRFNVSDKSSQGHREDVLREIGDLSEKIAEIRGSLSRINAK